MTSFNGDTFCPADSTLYKEEWARFYETSASVESALATNSDDTSILTEGLGEWFEYQEEICEPSSSLESSSSIIEGHQVHPVEGNWCIQFSGRAPVKVLIHPVVDCKLTADAWVIRGTANFTGDFKAEPGAQEAVIDIDFNIQDEHGYETRYCHGVYDPERDVISGTWISKTLIDLGDEWEHEPFIFRRTPIEVYRYRSILDNQVQSSTDSFARRRWIFATEAVRSQTQAYNNSSRSIVSRFSERQRLIRLVYEELSQGGTLKPEKSIELAQLFTPDVSANFKRYEALARYLFDRMMRDW